MDDIPMVDSPDVTQQQGFQIVDVIGGESSRSSLSSTLLSNQQILRSEFIEENENLICERLKKLYPNVDQKKNPLPRYWSTSDRTHHSLNISADALRARYKGRYGRKGNTKDAAAVRANHPIPTSTIIYYFEVYIADKGENGFMGVGVSENKVSLTRLPGWDPHSYGYHGDDGNFFMASGKGVDYGPTFVAGDTIGCGVNFVTRQLFFTRNGENLGVAASRLTKMNDLYPTVGMQTFGETIDANFGQLPFKYDIEKDHEATRQIVYNSVNNIELPQEKAIWMNRAVTAWFTHEGYSKALVAFNKATGLNYPNNNNSNSNMDRSFPNTNFLSGFVDGLQNDDSSQSESTSPDNLSNAIDLLGGDGISTTTTIAAPPMGGARRSTVLKSVQEAIYEEMENRRLLNHLVNSGKTEEAVKKLDEFYPTLLSCNKELALLLKIQQYIEMLLEISKDISFSSSSSPESIINGKQNLIGLNSFGYEQNNASSSSLSIRQQHQQQQQGSSSMLRGGKRSFTADNVLRNTLKRRSNEEETAELRESPRRGGGLPTNSANFYGLQISTTSTVAEQQQQDPQNGNSSSNNNNNNNNYHFEEAMDINEVSGGATNGRSIIGVGGNNPTNGCSIAGGGSGGFVSGTPPTSTTIVEDFDDFEDLTYEAMNSNNENGYSIIDLQEFEKYYPLIKFGHTISQFAEQNEGIISLALRKRMDDAFSLICHQNPFNSDNAYLLSQKQRTIVAKALNSCILESLGKESSNPMEEYFRKERLIREKASIISAAAHLINIDKLIFDDINSNMTTTTTNCQQQQQTCL